MRVHFVRLPFKLSTMSNELSMPRWFRWSNKTVNLIFHGKSYFYLPFVWIYKHSRRITHRTYETHQFGWNVMKNAEKKKQSILKKLTRGHIQTGKTNNYTIIGEFFTRNANNFYFFIAHTHRNHFVSLSFWFCNRHE